MAVGTDSFPFQKCIIHNIQTQKIWYYFYTCLRVPFNGWEHSRGRRGHRTIDINDRRVLWVGTDNYASKNALYTISRLAKYGIILIHASEYPSTGGSTAGAVGAIGQLISMIEGFYELELTIMLPKMHYTQYQDSENMVLFRYMPPSTLQPVRAQPGPSGPSDN